MNTTTDGLSLPNTPYTSRAVYLTPSNGFGTQLPKVPSHIFITERDQAFNPATGTAIINLDLSDKLKTEYPATTPNLLARYVRVKAGETQCLNLTSAGEVYYLLEGAGSIAKGEDLINWVEGDSVCLPGGGETVITAKDTDCVIYSVTDEPALSSHGAESPATKSGPIEAVHYPGDEVMRLLSDVQQRETEEEMTGRFVLFTNAGAQVPKTVTRTIGLAINSLEPGGIQTPHRHNSAALTLCLGGSDVYSMIEGEKVQWQRHAVMVTPPAELHAHHNEGKDMMLSLVAQDGGLFYNARAIGFSFD